MSKINTDQEKIDKILSRGVEDIIVKEHLESQLKSGKQLRIKFGADPTRPDLHLGHAVLLRKLRLLQDLGHHIIFIIGDFTARIGDPSGKSKTRPPLSEDEIEKNSKTYFEQVGKILNVSEVKIRKNSEWFSKMSFAEILKLTSQFSVARLIERDDFEKRMKSGKEVYLHELLYPIMQAYDSLILDIDIEFAGNDQKFNAHAGRDLQRKMGKPEQDILLAPLLVGLDGKEKMSKSLDNYIGITEAPNSMFGKIMSISDELISKYFLLCTDVAEEEIESMEKQMESGESNPRDAKMKLGREIIKIYHGAEAAQKAQDEFIKVFSQKELPEEIEEFRLETKEINILDLIEKAQLAKSRGEAKRLIEQGGIKINNETIENWDKEMSFKGGEILHVGKRKFLKIVISNLQSGD